jgi:peptide/nickel transport system permease protein
VLLGVIIVAFGMLHAVPGNPVRAISAYVSPEDIHQVESYYGFDKPIYVQFASYINHLFHGDLGYSLSRRIAVDDVLVPAMGNTAILASAGLIVALAVGLTVGVIASFRERSLIDRMLTSGILVLGNIPAFWLALVLIIIFSVWLHLLPVTGMHYFGTSSLPDLLRHLVLPTLSVAALPAAIIARVTRTAMLEISGAEFITAARARGLSKTRVFLRHVLRNALPPIVTMTGLQIGYLISGVIFVEVVFSWPGMGFYLYQGVLARDIPVVMGACILTAFFFVLANLVADVINLTLDPRIKVG